MERAETLPRILTSIVKRQFNPELSAFIASITPADSPRTQSTQPIPEWSVLAEDRVRKWIRAGNEHPVLTRTRFHNAVSGGFHGDYAEWLLEQAHTLEVAEASGLLTPWDFTNTYSGPQTYRKNMAELQQELIELKLAGHPFKLRPLLAMDATGNRGEHFVELIAGLHRVNPPVAGAVKCEWRLLPGALVNCPSLAQLQMLVANGIEQLEPYVLEENRWAIGALDGVLGVFYLVTLDDGHIRTMRPELARADYPYLISSALCRMVAEGIPGNCRGFSNLLYPDNGYANGTGTALAFAPLPVLQTLERFVAGHSTLLKQACYLDSLAFDLASRMFR